MEKWCGVFSCKYPIVQHHHTPPHHCKIGSLQLMCFLFFNYSSRPFDSCLPITGTASEETCRNAGPRLPDSLNDPDSPAKKPEPTTGMARLHGCDICLTAEEKRQVLGSFLLVVMASTLVAFCY